MAPSEPDLAALPDEMFTVIKSVLTQGPRLGHLRLPNRNLIETPYYLALTSRGVVPHITQDTFKRETSIGGVYVPLEDFVEKSPRQTPPIYTFTPPVQPGINEIPSPLRRFIALPSPTLLVLGARRTPPVVSPAANSNTNSTVAICTSVGFRQLGAEEYAEAAERLKPDIVVALGDVPYGRALGSKRVEKAGDRCEKWLMEHINVRRERGKKGEGGGGKLFASLLPVECKRQRYYVDMLVQEVREDVHGLALFGLEALEDMPEELVALPRMDFTEPDSPQEILRNVGLGVDVFTVPFVTAATDAGIALDFRFPAQEHHNGQEAVSLGIDIWNPEHATSLTPLVEGCKCYSCTDHHRAYIQHLLNAKEMLAWVLLQVHNHHIMDLFFAGIRKSISNGSFEQEVERFARVYEAQLPEKTGQGPRLRGYQFKSEGPGEPKKNAAPFTMLDDGKEKLAESTLPSAEANAEELEAQGFAEKQP